MGTQNRRRTAAALSEVIRCSGLDGAALQAELADVLPRARSTAVLLVSGPCLSPCERKRTQRTRMRT